MSAPSVYRIANVTDCREAGELVLIARGDDRIWIEAGLAVAIGAVGHRIRDRQVAEIKSREGWFAWSVGREAWIAGAILAVSFVCALVAMGAL